MHHFMAVILTLVSISWLTNYGSTDQLHIKEPLISYLASTKATEGSIKDFWLYSTDQIIQQRLFKMEEDAREMARLFDKHQEMAAQLRQAMAAKARNHEALSMEQIRTFQRVYRVLQEERAQLAKLLEEIIEMKNYGGLLNDIIPAQEDCDYETILGDLTDIEEYQVCVIERLRQSLEEGNRLLEVLQ